MKNRVAVVVLFLCISSLASAQWTKVATGLTAPVPHGTMVYCEGKVWCAWDQLMMSPDSGTTWTKINSPHAGSDYIWSVSFLDKNNGIISYYRHGHYVTHDAGMSWKPLQSPIANNYPHATFVDDVDHIILTSGYHSEIAASTNGGLTWKVTQYDDDDLVSDAPKKAGNKLIAFSGGERFGGFLRSSTDKGLSWQTIPGRVDWDSYGFGIDSCIADRYYIINEHVYEEDKLLSKIFVSTDAGMSWKEKAVGRVKFFCGSIALTRKAAYCPTVHGDTGIYRSTDNGETWASMGGPPSCTDSHLITAIGDTILLVVDSLGNLWKMTSPLNYKTSTYQFSSTKIVSDSLGAIIRLPIFLKHTGTMPAIDMVMHYPEGPLDYLGGFLYYGKSIDVPGSRWDGRAKLHFEADDLNGLPDSLVGYVVFKWFPLEFDCAFIKFDSMPGSSYSNCIEGGVVVKGAPFTGIIGAYEWCGTSEVPQQKTTSIPLFSFTPNPAGAYGSIVSSSYEGMFRYSLSDINGKLLRTREAYVSPAIPFRLELDDLTSGVYHLSILAGSMPPADLLFMHYRE